MPGYALFCTTCKNSVESRAAWLSHLLHEAHQKAARSEIGRWGQAERKTALVVYANFPVSTNSSSGGLSFLEHFSTEVGFLVTDFVLIPELPQVAVVQFESKTRAREVLERAGGAKVSINGQLAQLRKAEDYLKFEWQALLSRINPITPGDGHETRSDADDGKRHFMNEPAHSDDSEQMNGTSRARKRKRSSVSNLLPGSAELTNLGTSSASELRLQYEQLCRSVEISDDEFNVALQFLHKLEELASTKKMPTCKLYMFRTWHLKLRSLGGDELLLFIDSQGYFSGEIDYIAHSAYGQVIKNVFSSDAEAELRRLGMTFRRRGRKDLANVGEFVCSHPASGIKFTIWPDVHPWLVPEVQACRMLEYLVTFDIRVKPLYTLIFYWTNVNNIRLSQLEQKIGVTPEPAAMEWLVMLFLCHKKIVPTPREVLERESPQRIPVLKENVDMGFFADTKFASAHRTSSRDSLPPEDSDDFVLNILELVEAFFSFCVSLSSGSWILNTRDGEVIKTEEFASEKPGITRLTSSEREAVRRMRNSNFLATALRERNFVGFLHPLYLRQRFAFTDDEVFIKNVIPVMTSTAKKLAQFLQDESYREEVLTSRVINLKYLFHEM